MRLDSRQGFHRLFDKSTFHIIIIVVIIIIIRGVSTTSREAQIPGDRILERYRRLKYDDSRQLAGVSMRQDPNDKDNRSERAGVRGATASGVSTLVSEQYANMGH